MKLINIRFFATIFLAIALISCGKKTSPIAKTSLQIPPPAMIEMQVVGSGVEIVNLSDNETVYVERKDSSGDGVSLYYRVALVKPKASFIDSQVSKGKKYSYRFRNYYPAYKTYSSPVVQNISYNMLIELDNIKVDVVLDSLCVSATMNDDITYADVVVNGKFIKKMYRDKLACLNLPSTSYIDLILIPYNAEGISGIVYSNRIQRDEKELLLPPQNVKMMRSNDSVILSWDKGVDIDEYNIFKLDNGTKTLLQKSSATLLRYVLSKKEDCVQFILYSKRGGFLSEAINISACK